MADTGKGNHPLDAFRISSLPDSFYYVPNFITSEEEAAIVQKMPSHRWITLSHRHLQVHPSQLSSSNTLLDAPLPAWLSITPPILQRFTDLEVFRYTPHGKPNHCLINEYKPGEGIMPHEDGAAYAPVVATVSLGDSIVLDIYDKSKKTGDVNGNKETGSGSKLVARPFQEISDNKTDSSDVKANGHEDRSDALKPVARIFQEPGSLLVTTGAAYTSLLHGISPVPYDVNLGPSNVANWDSLSEKTRDGITQHNGTHIRGVRTSLTYRDVLKVRKIGIGVVGRR